MLQASGHPTCGVSGFGFRVVWCLIPVKPTWLPAAGLKHWACPTTWAVVWPLQSQWWGLECTTTLVVLWALKLVCCSGWLCIASQNPQCRRNGAVGPFAPRRRLGEASRGGARAPGWLSGAAGQGNLTVPSTAVSSGRGAALSGVTAPLSQNRRGARVCGAQGLRHCDSAAGATSGQCHHGIVQQRRRHSTSCWRAILSRSRHLALGRGEHAG